MGVVADAEEHGTRASFDGQQVLIERRDGLAKRIFGQRQLVISIDQIGSLDWKEPSWRSVGHLRFAVAGHTASAVLPPARDTHALIFSKKRREDFEVLRDAVQHAMASRTAAG